MPECSLCGNPMPDEGGAVLFAQRDGTPFEVCGECETRIDRYRQAGTEEEAAQTLDYVYEHAKDLSRRDAYDSLMQFMEENRPDAAGEIGDELPEDARDSDEDIAYELEDKTAEASVPDEETCEADVAGREENEAEHDDAGNGKRGVFKSVILVGVIVALLLLAWILSGFRLF